jgi:hypothetical protein
MITSKTNSYWTLRKIGNTVHDDGPKMIIPLVQISKNVEDEVVVGDHTTEIVEGVGHALHLAIVVTHREVTLDEVVQRGVKVKRTCLAVADELLIKSEPHLALGDNAITLIGIVLQLAGDRAKDPREDDYLHVPPRRIVSRGGIRENVVGEVIALQSEEDLIAPAGVACRRVHNSRDKGADILYSAGLLMECGNGGGITPGGWGWRHARGGHD